MSLPSGYKRVAYIQSSGTQYIDTGFKPNNNTRVVMVSDIISTTSTYTPFGVWDANGSNQFAAVATSSIASRIYCGSVYKNGSISILGKHTIDMNKNVLYVDGQEDPSVTASTFQCSYSLFLCTWNNAGTPRDNNWTSLKIYSCQIYDNGTLVRNFVPCINPSGVAGLYDLVNDVFYTDGAGVGFTYGELTFLEYIESSGTQYVKTGIFHNPTSCPGLRMVIDAEILSTTGAELNGIGSYQSFYVGQMNGYLYYSPYYGDFNTNVAYSAINRYVYDLNNAANKFDIKTTNGSIVFSTGTTVGTPPGSREIYLFAFNASDSGTVGGFTKQKLYSTQIYDNGTLVRNFRPAQAGDEVGLWDALNEVFYPNAGTGTFAAGPVASADTPENFEQVLAVFLRWSSVDCEGYNIYRDGVLLGTTTDTYYIDLTADENEQYTYTLTAFNGSAESDPATLEVYTRSGYFVLKPVIESAFFQ